MEEIKRLLAYTGRFLLIHLIAYTLIAFPFLFIQDTLSTANRVALEFFQPYSVDFITLFGQAVRGILLALLLYPFYSLLVTARRRRLYLFGVLWGLALLGAVEPIPGSIEGVIYTETPVVAHLLVLGAGALQILLFCWLFLNWEISTRRPTGTVQAESARLEKPLSKRLGGFSLRFTLLHVVSYTVVGILFMQLQDYAAAFATQPQFELYRPLDDPLVGAALPIQIVRGALLAWLLYPFYVMFIQSRRGWLLIFNLMFGFTALGSAILIPEIVARVMHGEALAHILTLGWPEVFTQMLIFSWLLFVWERRSYLKAESMTNQSGNHSKSAPETPSQA